MSNKMARVTKKCPTKNYYGTLINAKTIDDISSDDINLIGIDFFEKYLLDDYLDKDIMRIKKYLEDKNIDISVITFDIMVDIFGIYESLKKIITTRINIGDERVKYIEFDNLNTLNLVKDIHQMGIDFNSEANSKHNFGEFIITEIQGDEEMLSVVEYLNEIGFDLRKVGKRVLNACIDFYDNGYEFIWDIIDQQNFDKEDIKNFVAHALLISCTVIVEKIMERNLVSASECEKIAMEKLLGTSELEESEHVKICEKIGFNPKFVWLTEKFQEGWQNDDFDHNYRNYVKDMFPYQ